MKRKGLTALLLSAALLLSGCGSMLESMEDAVRNAEPSITPGTTISSDSKWINSDIIGAIDADTEVREQDDFFTAVNRDAILGTDIAAIADGDSVGTMYDVRGELYERIAKLMTASADDVSGLDEQVMSADALRHVQSLVKALYDEAADISLRNEQGVEPLRPYVESIEKIDSMDALTAYFGDVGNTNVSDLSLLPFTISRPKNVDDEEKYSVLVTARTLLSLDDEADQYSAVSLDDKTVTEEVLHYALEKLGYTSQEVQQILHRCYRFEIRLAKHMPTVSKTDGESDREEINVAKQYTRCDLAELKAMAGNYPIETLLSAAGLAGSEDYLVEEPDQVKNVGTLYTESNLEDIKSYLLVQLVRSNTEFLDEKIFMLAQQAQSKENQQSLRMDTDTDAEDAENTADADPAAEDAENSGSEDGDDEEALDTDLEEVLKKAGINTTVLTAYVQTYLRDAYEEMYIGHYCDAETKAGLVKLTEQVADGFREVVQQADWMSEETREKALDKLDHMGMHILYPDKLTDFTALDLSDCSSLVEMMGRIFAFRQAGLKDYVNQPLDGQLWDLQEISTTDANAYYLMPDNSINICAGFLCTDAIFSTSESAEYNLARMGAIIGHEISHGFDTAGYSYNRIGLQENWWTKADQENFDLRSRNLVKYYNVLAPLPGSEELCDGTTLSGEAVADMGGLKAALYAGKKLSDFDTAEFFRNYAALWFVQRHYYDEYSLLQKDNHPLAFLRVNVTVQQFPEFREAFGVVPGDGMYLADDSRIAVW